MFDQIREFLSENNTEDALTLLENMPDQDYSTPLLYLVIKLYDRTGDNEHRDFYFHQLQDRHEGQEEEFIIQLARLIILWADRDIAEFTEHTLECQHLFSLLGDTSRISPYFEAELYHFLGVSALLQSKLEQAKRHLLHAADLRSQLNDIYSLAAINNNLAVIHVNIGELEEALRYFELSEGFFYRLDDQSALATIFNNLGGIYQALGNINGAYRFFIRAHDLAVETGNTDTEQKSLNNLGNIELLRGNLDDAKQLFYQSITLKETSGDRLGLAYSFHNLAKISMQVGNYDHAIKMLQRSISFRENSIDTDLITSYFLLLVNYIKIDDHLQAKKTLADILEVDKSSENEIVHHISLLSKAFFMANSSLVPSKFVALDFLKRLMDKEVLNSEFQALILIKYLQLKLELMEVTPNPDIESLSFYADSLYKIAQQLRAVPMTIESMIIKAKLQFLNQDYTKARFILTQAGLLAVETGLDHLEYMCDKVLDEMDMLKQTQLSMDDVAPMIRQSLDQMEYVALQIS